MQLQHSLLKSPNLGMLALQQYQTYVNWTVRIE